MSGPKHLWSGDWRNESAAASDELAARRPKPRQPEQPQSNVWPPPPKPKPKRPRPGLRRALPIALAVVLVLAAGTYGATALFGSSKHQAPAFATQPSISPAPTPTSRRRRPSTGSACRSRPCHPARLPSRRCGREPADLAGLSPGDAIVQIDSRPINGTGDISAAIRGMHAGQRVAMEISHGSALFTTVVTLAAPPSTSP